MTLKSITQSLTAQGIAIAALGGSVYPTIATPLKNLAAEILPDRKIITESAIDIVGGLLVAGGTTTALIGRIRAGGVYTPDGLYGPNKGDAIEDSQTITPDRPDETIQ